MVTPWLRHACDTLTQYIVFTGNTEYYTVLSLSDTIMTTIKDKHTLITLLSKLITAQELLSDVYHTSIEMDDSNIESLMSAADSCIIESIDSINVYLKQGIE